MICQSELHHPHETTVVCPHALCGHISHVTCLSVEFLRQEASEAAKANMGGQQGGHALALIETQVLPVNGRCPSCRESTQWVDIVKPLTYRLRVKVPEKKTMQLKRLPRIKKQQGDERRKRLWVDDQMGYEENDDDQMEYEDEENDEEGVAEEDQDEEEVSEADDEDNMGTASNSDASDIEDWLWRDPFAEYYVQEASSDMDTDESVME